MAFPLVAGKASRGDRESLVNDGDAVAGDQAKGAAAGDFRLRHGKHQLAAPQHDFDLSKMAMAAAAAMDPAIAVARLGTSFLLKPQYRPGIGSHLNLQIPAPLPPRVRFLHRRDFTPGRFARRCGI
jgi:hypothetical protein